jgi:hypothetical protein
MDRSLASHSLLYKIHVAAKIGADSQNPLLEAKRNKYGIIRPDVRECAVDSQLGKQIKTEVENSAIKEARIARLAVAEQEKHRQTQLSLPRERSSTPYGLTRQEFTSCVQKNFKYLDDGFKGDMKFMKKGFGVEDFDSNKYIVTEEYLSALGQNKKLQPLIDKSSELGKKIKDSVEHQKLLERMRGNERG